MANRSSVRTRNGTAIICACAERGAIAAAFLLASGVTLLPATPLARADIHDNLVVHLPFDGDVTDKSARGNNGTIVRPGANAPFVPGIIGLAFQTQGSAATPDAPTGNYVTLGNPDDLNFGTNSDFSLSWWGQYTSGAQHDDIPWLSNKAWNSGTNVGWVLASQGGGNIKWNFRALFEERYDCSYSGGGLDDGKWHHYVFTFMRGSGGNPGTGTIYLDGGEVNECPIDVTFTGDINKDPYTCNLATNVMQDGTGLYTDGGSGANWDNALIDDLGIWRRAITPDEVSLIYTMGLQGKSALD